MKFTTTVLALALSGMCSHAKPSIIGVWSIPKVVPVKSDSVVTFLADGTYTMGEEENPNLEPRGRARSDREFRRFQPIGYPIAFGTSEAGDQSICEVGCCPTFLI